MRYYDDIYIGINYRTPDKTIQWIQSIIEHDADSLIVVVDNSREYNLELKGDIQKISNGNIIYLDSGKNRGYFNGAAYGYRYIKKRFEFHWIIVCNVDIALKTKNPKHFLDKYEGCGVIAPAIISYDTGIDKNPYRMSRASKVSMRIKKISFSNNLFSNVYGLLSLVRNRLIAGKHKEKPKCNEGGEIYLPYGACFIFSKYYFEKGCKIDFPLFLFGEELYVAEQCLRAGLKILYVPSVKFINYEHASTSRLTNSFVTRCNYKAIRYILDEFYE